MATKTITVPLPDDHAEPAWEVALLLPAQGEWSEDDYLWLTDRTRRLVEFTDGRVEVLPMSTDEHQRIVLFLYRRGRHSATPQQPIPRALEHPTSL